MIPWWWSWLLTAAGVTGLWLVGSGKGWAWAINIAAQLLWIGYALATGQYGFLVSALVYGTVFTRNWLAWAKPVPASPATCDCADLADRADGIVRVIVSRLLGSDADSPRGATILCTARRVYTWRAYFLPYLKDHGFTKAADNMEVQLRDVLKLKARVAPRRRGLKR